MAKQEPGPSGRRAAKPLFISFAMRHGRSGGAIAARGFERIARAVFGGETCSVFQDDACGPRDLGTVRMEVGRRANLAMLVRLLATGDIGRHRFRFFASAGADAAGRAPAVVDGVGHASILRSLRPHFHPVVMVHQNYEPDYYADMYEGRWQKPWMVRAGTRGECLSAREADVNLFVTREDMMRFRGAFPGARGVSAVLGVHEACARPAPAAGDGGERIRVLVTGGMADRKGVVGLIDWLRAATARRAELSRRMCFVIAGRGAPAEIRRAADGDFVTLHEDVPAMEPIARTCDIYVNPNFTGSGIKLRNLDGLRNGLPVLCRRENAAGFRELDAGAFRTFDSSDEGLDLVNAKSAAELRDERLRRLVWDEYVRHFSVEVGIRRFRDAIAAASPAHETRPAGAGAPRGGGTPDVVPATSTWKENS